MAEPTNYLGPHRVATKLLLPLLKMVALAALTTSTILVADPHQISSDSEVTLRKIVAAGQLMDLRWPIFSDYQVHVKDFYEPSGYAPAWIQDGEPTRQARSVIETLQQADSKGLHSEDYDGSRWPDRLARTLPFPSTSDEARFDVALTVCIMRYLSDLRIGRVNPRQFQFNLDVGPKKYDLASFLHDKLVSSADVGRQLSEVEPPFAGYKRTLEALQHYLELAREDDGEKLPVPGKTVDSGSPYAGLPRLTRLLRLLGDLPPDVLCLRNEFMLARLYLYSLWKGRT